MLAQDNTICARDLVETVQSISKMADKPKGLQIEAAPEVAQPGQGSERDKPLEQVKERRHDHRGQAEKQKVKQGSDEDHMRGEESCGQKIIRHLSQISVYRYTQTGKFIRMFSLGAKALAATH